MSNSKELEISLKGDKILKLNENRKLYLKNVLVIPNTNSNVLSISKLT